MLYNDNMEAIPHTIPRRQDATHQVVFPQDAEDHPDSRQSLATAAHYVEPPDIPAGMTILEYKRAKVDNPKPRWWKGRFAV